MFRFVLFKLGIITGLFNVQEFTNAITEGCRDGYRLVRREFSIEPRRILLVLRAYAFGMVFQRDADSPAEEYEWAVANYRTRFFTKTIDVKKLEATLNEVSGGTGELFFAMKYPCRFLFIFPPAAPRGEYL